MFRIKLIKQKPLKVKNKKCCQTETQTESRD